MPEGRVTRWNGQTGFIDDHADGMSCFFGDRSLDGLQPGDVRVGLEVSFERGMGDRGPRAFKVRRRQSGSATSPPSVTAPTGRVGVDRGPRMGGSERPMIKKSIETSGSFGVDDKEKILAEIPVPGKLRELLKTLHSDSQRHPGLMLDRFVQPCPKQEQQKDVLSLVAGLPGNEPLLKDLLARRHASLEALGVRTWSRTTQTPLTLHLARASALENAGICLHPIYGFTYLPGTGLKGMARAYAETVWLPTQTDQVAASLLIKQVFGWAPGSDRGSTKYGSSHAGDIVFHDAWPEAWPRLVVDIVNNHHPGYYQAKEGDEGNPGDWDSPNPVYFLAVKPRTTFHFGLGKRRYDVSAELLSLAEVWLDGALTQIGCGAKTAAGYGGFAPRSNTVRLKSPRLLEEQYTLELVTPGFLAGASQVEEDCTLRSATLRGLLRWWWRTFHVGFMDTDTLRSLEGAVWGDTTSGGAIGLRVVPVTEKKFANPCPYKKIEKRNNKDGLIFDPEFMRRHGLDVLRRRSTQGLAYAGYGMDEPGGRNERRRQRWFAEPGTKWRVELTARPGRFTHRDRKGKVLREVELPDPSILLDQARLALWWFCKLGGAGSKSRKGFGSFAFPGGEFGSFDGQKCLVVGNALRERCGLPTDVFREDWIQSPSFRLMFRLAGELQLNNNDDWLRIRTQWNDPWKVLDEIGWAMQHFAQQHPDDGPGRHCPEKRNLGLPRRIDGPPPAPTRDLRAVHGDRHSSPTLFHVSRERDSLVIDIAAFPQPTLREEGMPQLSGLEENRGFLRYYLQYLKDYFEDRLNTRPGR